MTTDVIFWQLLATYGNFWQLMSTFGNCWHILTTDGQVQVDGGVLGLQIADDGTSQKEEEEEASQEEEEEEVRVNNHEWSADVLELELDL